jgi:RNA polymerase sigma-70 factor (ECF subfamily)
MANDGGSAVTHDLPRDLAETRFSDLYRDHARELLGYALRRSADPDDAADVVAETFLVAWRRLGEVPPGSEARLWLYGTARHVLANQDRGARRRDRLTERLRVELRQQLPALRPQERGVFLEALAGLREADRELLMLIGWEELTPTEAAQALGISPRAARTRLHRARRRLRARLAEQPAGTSQNTEIEVEEAR